MKGRELHNQWIQSLLNLLQMVKAPCATLQPALEKQRFSDFYVLWFDLVQQSLMTSSIIQLIGVEQISWVQGSL